MGVRGTIRDASMRYPLAVQHQKIIVMGDDHPRIVPRKGKLHVIRGAQQTGFGRDGDVYPMPPQTIGNGMVNIFIQVEAYPWGYHVS